MGVSIKFQFFKLYVFFYFSCFFILFQYFFFFLSSICVIFTIIVNQINRKQIKKTVEQIMIKKTSQHFPFCFSRIGKTSFSNYSSLKYLETCSRLSTNFNSGFLFVSFYLPQYQNIYEWTKSSIESGNNQKWKTQNAKKT